MVHEEGGLQCPKKLSTWFLDGTTVVEVEKAKKKKKFRMCYLSLDTHGIKSLTITAIAYFINSLDGQTSGRERGEPVFL